jgi:anti-sigma-K factor RskA
MEAGIHELTAGYALDALTPEERAVYELHLAECEHCREELASFWETTAALAVAASGPEPNAALRQRVLEAVRAEPPQNVVPFEPRRRRLAPALGAVAAVAAVVALALGIWGASLSSDLDETRAALEREQAAAAVLADPDVRSVALVEGDGRLVVGPDGDAVLVVDGLGPAPAGKTYELWVSAQGEDPVPAGVFPGGDGREVALVDGTVDTGEVVLVTIEPAGGVDAPTTEPIVGTAPV